MIYSRYKFSFLISLTLIISNSSKAQSISPATFNNGGGFNGGAEWSISESVSIANFSANNILLTTGVLQPLSNVVTSINEYGPLVFGQQITVGPNPAVNYVDFKANFNQVGNLSFQLLDAKSKIIISKEQGSIFSAFQTRLHLEDYPSGMYYIKIFFKPFSGALQTGVYKIIKL
jgi:hypothetical protein